MDPRDHWPSIPSRDEKPRRVIDKYQNHSEYDITTNQVRITQRLTDRAIRSHVKIYDIHDYVIKEDLAQIADRLTRAGHLPIDGEANLTHYPVCPSVNSEYRNNNLVWECHLYFQVSLVVSSPSAVLRKDIRRQREMINHIMVRGTATPAGLLMTCLVSMFGGSSLRRRTCWTSWSLSPPPTS